MAGRAGLLWGSVFLLLPWSASAAEKKVLLLRSGENPLYDFAVKGFTEGLAARKVPCGFKDVVMAKTPEDASRMWTAIRDFQPDLVLTIGTSAARVMKEGGLGLPFIYAMIVDPPFLGLSSGGAVMEVKPSAQVDFIRKNFPRMRRVGVIHSPARNREIIRLFQEERSSDITLILIPADTPEEMSKAIQRLGKEADCLLMISDAILYSPQTVTQIILQSIQNNLPIVAVSPTFVRAGALAAIYPSYEDNGQVAAEAAARFFAGEKLDAIPVLWPSKTNIAVNLIVAHQLGVVVSQRTIDAAEQVVQ